MSSTRIYNPIRGLITVNGVDSLGNTVCYNYQCNADGTTDDRAKILSALNKAIVSMPCVVEFGEGDYAMSDGIELDLADNSQGLTIKGQGANVTKLVWHNAVVNNYYLLKIFSDNAKTYKSANSGAENVAIYPSDIYIEDIGFFDDDPFAHQTRGNDFIGTADSGNATTMTDTGAFTAGLFNRVGESTKFYIANTTTGAIGKIASNTVDTITFDELVAGSSASFTAGDGYQISCVDADNATYGNQVEETHSITVQYCRNVHIRNCSADAIGDEAFNFSFVKQGSMTGLSCTHVPSMSFGGGAITLQHGCEDIQVADNNLDAGKTYGLLSEFEGSQGINLEAIDLAPISNISITGNKIRGMGANGININSSYAGTTVSEITIAGNNIVNCGIGIGRLGSQPLNNVTVIGNTITDISNYGIDVDTTHTATYAWVISDNVISNCAVGGMQLNMSNALLSNNTFVSCARGLRINYGVNLNIASGTFTSCGGGLLEEIEDTTWVVSGDTVKATTQVSNVIIEDSNSTNSHVKGVLSLKNSTIKNRNANTQAQRGIYDVKYVSGCDLECGIESEADTGSGGIISNNRISYFDGGPTNSGDAIILLAGQNDWVITGNSIDLTTCTNNQACVKIAGNDAVITGNRFKSKTAGATNAIADTGTGNYYETINVADRNQPLNKTT